MVKECLRDFCFVIALVTFILGVLMLGFSVGNEGQKQFWSNGHIHHMDGKFCAWISCDIEGL